MGVFLAVYVNNSVKVANEKQQIKSLLEFAATEIHKKEKDAQGKINGRDNNETVKILNLYPIDKPLLFIALFSNDLFHQYCYPATTPLVYLKDYIISELNIINNPILSQEQRINALYRYANSIAHVNDLLKVSSNIIDSGGMNNEDFEQIENELVTKNYFIPEENKK